VEVEDAVGFVRHHQRPLAQWVLGGDPGRALVGVAALRLNAADCYAPQNSTITR